MLVAPWVAPWLVPEEGTVEAVDEAGLSVWAVDDEWRALPVVPSFNRSNGSFVCTPWAPSDPTFQFEKKWMVGAMFPYEKMDRWTHQCRCFQTECFQ